MKSFTVKEWLLGKGPSATLSYNKGTAAHNDFIEYLFDYGVLGLIAFLGLIASLLVQYFKQKKIDKREMRIIIIYMFVINMISAFFINMNMLYMILPSSQIIERTPRIQKNIGFYEVKI